MCPLEDEAVELILPRQDRYKLPTSSAKFLVELARQPVVWHAAVLDVLDQIFDRRHFKAPIPRSSHLASRDMMLVRSWETARSGDP